MTLSVTLAVKMVYGKIFKGASRYRTMLSGRVRCLLAECRHRLCSIFTTWMTDDITISSKRDAAQQGILWRNILLRSKNAEGLQPIKIRQGNGYDVITGRLPRPFSTWSYNVVMEEELIAAAKVYPSMYEGMKNIFIIH